MPQPSDAAASGFYVTNPNNRLTNNAASGGYSGACTVWAALALDTLAGTRLDAWLPNLPASSTDNVLFTALVQASSTLCCPSPSGPPVPPT